MPDIPLLGLGILAFGFIVLFFCINWLVKRRHKKIVTSDPLLQEEATLTITPTELHSKTASTSGSFIWSSVHKVVETKAHVFIFLSSHRAYAINRDFFDSPKSANDFYQAALKYWEAAQ